jgi:exopolysaccharide biosynthesis polyprenyl glycosylphosphotransferase
VTTSLHQTTQSPERKTGFPVPDVDTFSFPTVPPPAGGVPRAGWLRTRRASRWHRPYAGSLVLLDALAAVLASWTAIRLLPQAGSGFGSNGAHPPWWFYAIAYGGLPVAWVVLLWGHGGYDRRYLGIGTDEWKRVNRASLFVVAVVSFLAFTLQADLSRLSVAVALFGALLLILLFRLVARKTLHLLRRRGRASQMLLLLGTLNETLDVHTAVTRNTSAGLRPVAIHVSDGFTARHARTPVPVYSNRDVVALVREVGADTIAVCGAASAEPGELRRLAWLLEGTGVDLVVAPQLTDIAGPRVHIRPVEGLPLLHVEEPTLSGVAWLAKNLLDRVAAVIGMLLTLPILAVVAFLIKVTSPGPVFFRQTRIGREGKTFRVWKFRTMYLDAEDRLAHLYDQNESDGLLFKIKNDPRVTPVGKFLRASSMDELPQLINVLVGEMSLVGPRPLPAEDGDFLGDVRRRLLVRPGITGLWQVSGRSDLSWDDAVRLDLYYVDNWSLAFDISILWRTIGVVLGSKGAY